jgi:hypothetical protein
MASNSISETAQAVVDVRNPTSGIKVTFRNSQALLSTKPENAETTDANKREGMEMKSAQRNDRVVYLVFIPSFAMCFGSSTLADRNTVAGILD